MGKDGLVVLQEYIYTAPTALPIFMLAGNPRQPLRSDLGLRIWRTSSAHYLSHLINFLLSNHRDRLCPPAGWVVPRHRNE